MSAHHGPPCDHDILGTCVACGGTAPVPPTYDGLTAEQCLDALLHVQHDDRIEFVNMHGRTFLGRYPALTALQCRTANEVSRGYDPGDEDHCNCGDHDGDELTGELLHAMIAFAARYGERDPAPAQTEVQDLVRKIADECGLNVCDAEALRRAAAEFVELGLLDEAIDDVEATPEQIASMMLRLSITPAAWAAEVRARADVAKEYAVEALDAVLEAVHSPDDKT